MKRRLLHKYGDSITITELSGKFNVVMFYAAGQKILTDSRYKNRRTEMADERKRIVTTAAEIILQDIHSQAYNCDMYPTEQEIASGSPHLIPETLRLLVESVVLSKKRGDLNQWKRKCISVEHAIVSCARPRSFVSPVQIGLALHLNRQFGSKQLVELANNIGFCSSYAKANKYEASLVEQTRSKIDSSGYIQFVFDNADFNIRTLTGLGTFHSMGGIKYVTPATSAHTVTTAQRPKTYVLASVIGEFAKVQIKPYKESTMRSSSLVHDVFALSLHIPKTVSESLYMTSLWLCGCWLPLTCCPSWNGFMSVATKDTKYYDTSKFQRLAFINIDPSNPLTIYTALCFAADECLKQKQCHYVVTFDQPLHWKSVNIVEGSEELFSLIIRLGSFHLLMSYLESVGYIMGGSGLAELWKACMEERR